MNKHRLDFECENLGNGIFRINEFDFVNAFLVVGDEKAALLDCGVGIGQLREFAETLTDKPIIVLVTHAHADHDGGAVWFKEIYIHPLDKRISEFDQTAAARIYFLHQHPYKRKTHKVRFSDAFQKEFTPVRHDLNEGDTFDLGGRVIETFFTPGHTAGHVTFRDSLTGALFTGDNVNPLVTLQFPGAVSLEEWRESAVRTLLLADGNPIYGGHGDGRIPAQVIEANIALADEILTQPNEEKGTVKKKTAGEKLPAVVYKTDKIHKK
ncbi:MAG: MBL fold metallo-hydrolase [Clostridia bacterium]|nr:MBL fold metallo-hydrolase [Clostridia bacterium]